MAEEGTGGRERGERGGRRKGPEREGEGRKREGPHDPLAWGPPMSYSGPATEAVQSCH